MLTEEEIKWNPRYVYFAECHKHSPEEQLEHDKEAWPGGRMCGFILFMSKMNQKFYKEHKECFIGKTISDHKKFDEFIKSQIGLEEFIIKKSFNKKYETPKAN